MENLLMNPEKELLRNHKINKFLKSTRYSSLVYNYARYIKSVNLQIFFPIFLNLCDFIRKFLSHLKLFPFITKKYYFLFIEDSNIKINISCILINFI